MTKSKAIVTQTRFDQKVRPGKCKVYVNSDNPVDKMLEAWFDKNKIYQLTFKSRAWMWLSNQRHKLFAQLIGEALGCGWANVKFSHKAGCSCGCSPGFNVSLPQQALLHARSDVWVDIEINGMPFDYDQFGQIADQKLAEDKQREINKARPAINQPNA